MSWKQDRLQEIINYCIVHGENKTLEKYSIKRETLKRYKRRFVEFERESIKPKPPKILLFDIETSPVLAFT